MEKPQQGEKTGNQHAKGGLAMASTGQIATFFPAPSGTYEIYRRISSHPTVALVMSIVKSPIEGNTWNWVKRDKSVNDEWVECLSRIMDPIRSDIMKTMLRALEFGWAPAEKIWKYGNVTLASGATNHMLYLERLKPLLWDYTELHADRNGNVDGIVNDVPGRNKIELPLNKCVYYVNDPQPGSPYGRSRHENIREIWNEAEQLRQKVAQYMKKISGVIVMLHYPEGSSNDPSGAARSNQELAQGVLDSVSAGFSAMFPNGFASADIQSNPELAYKLAGQSLWKLDFANPGGTDYAPGMKEVLAYYDELLFQGWLRPARVGLEAKHGSRADVQTHSDTGTYDAEAIDRDIAIAVNQQIVDEILVMNFGEDARGAVYADPSPISTYAQQTRLEVLKAILANAQTGPLAYQQIDVRGICDDMDVPLLKQLATTEKNTNEAQVVSSPGASGAADVTPDKPTAKSSSMEKMLADAGYNKADIAKRLAKRKSAA